MSFVPAGAGHSLRFFLRGQPAEVLRLYELIFNNSIAVAVADSAGDAGALMLGPSAIRPVGFEPDQGVLPYPARSPLGYRLLTEYFAFPEKFLFFDVAGLAAKARVSRRARCWRSTSTSTAHRWSWSAARPPPPSR